MTDAMTEPTLVWTLSGFADEIAPDLPTQLDVLTELGIGHLELRSIDGVNVLELTDRQVDDAERLLRARGVRVSAIGSPLGKTPIGAPFEETLDRLDRALELAARLDVRLIRLFSFYPDGSVASEGSGLDGSGTPDDRSGDGRGTEAAREAAFPEAIRRLRLMADRAARRGVVLAHENEKRIVGESAEECVRLLEGVASPFFRAAFDPANFVQAGVAPYPDAFDRLRPWIEYLQVKDARFETGEVVPAGDGDARFPELLRALVASGFSGFVSLEPHLADGKPGGGPDAFRRAARALLRLVGELDEVELR